MHSSGLLCFQSGAGLKSSICTLDSTNLLPDAGITGYHSIFLVVFQTAYLLHMINLLISVIDSIKKHNCMNQVKGIAT